MRANRFYKALLLLLFTGLSSCQLSRFVFYNFADIRDYKKFPSRTLHHDSTVFHFATTAKGKAPKTVTDKKHQEVAFASYLQSNKTVAFLIIQNDTIQYEHYFAGYKQESIVPSFSMAKSVTSILIGCAIEDGLIRSVDDPVIQYIPELKDKKGFEQITIRHLLQMTSGIRFNESYVNPFGDAASFYYGRQLRKGVFHMKIKSAPGEQFDYISGNTQVLGLVLERALKNKTITAYLQEKIWQPLGMEYDGSWSIDKKKDGMEKTFCCLNARARDFAKIGRLYQNNGNWNGKQVVPATWVQESTKIDTANGSAWYYQYQWWIPSKDGDFMAQGILGQFIYVNPAKNLVIVRLGKKEGQIDWWDLFRSLSAAY